MIPAPDPAALLAFTPVPRKVRRADGWTPDRQRAFIAALAQCGSVTAAARRVNMCHATAYDLYNHPEGAAVRAAWDQALALGIQRLHDVAMERAVDGTASPVFYKGEQVGERRQYNDHLLGLLLRHHAFGAQDGSAAGKSQSRREREAAEHCAVCRDRRIAEDEEAANAPGEAEAAEEFAI